jgi:hypothetical protein
MPDPTGKCLSWLCVQHLRTSELARGSSANRGASIVRLLLEHHDHTYAFTGDPHYGTFRKGSSARPSSIHTPAP